MNVDIIVLNCQKCNQCLKSSLRSQVSRTALWGCSLNVMVKVIVIVHFGQVMSPHHPDQMSQVTE